jgi:hypothetical protein
MNADFAKRLTLSVPIAAIDAQNGVLKRVAVLTEGPAIGHGITIDSESIKSVLQRARSYSGGLKVKLEHGSGAGSIVGVLQNFNIDGRVLRADLKLFKASPHFNLICEMAETAPQSVGLSISFSGENQEINGAKRMRCVEIYSADLVDQPAANPNGLFERNLINMNLNTNVQPDTTASNSGWETYTTPTGFRFRLKPNAAVRLQRAHDATQLAARGQTHALMDCATNETWLAYRRSRARVLAVRPG